MQYAIEVEIERNFAAFKDMLDSLLPREAGNYALLRSQRLEGIYRSPGDAERAGLSKFNDECYSIQLVSDQPVDLGFYSSAIAQG